MVVVVLILVDAFLAVAMVVSIAVYQYTFCRTYLA